MPFLAVLAAATFLGFLGRRDIVTSHEARVAQTAREMAAAGWPWQDPRVRVPAVELTKVEGISRLTPVAGGAAMEVNPWLVPVLNDQIRLQKPPLPYWCAAVLFKLTGGSEGSWGEAQARFVPALLGALSLLPLWGLARMLLGRAGAWAAALVWVSSYFVLDESRKAMADPYLAFFTLTAVWAWVRGSEEKRRGDAGTRGRGEKTKNATEADPLPLSSPRVSSPPPRVPASLLFLYLSLALGVMAKGPVILITVPLALAAWHVCWRRRPPGPWWGHLLGIGIFALVAGPWYGYVYLHVPHAVEIARYESIGELSDNVEKARGWWFYLPALFQINLPWTPLWMVGMALPVVRHFRRRNEGRGFEVVPAGAGNPGRPARDGQARGDAPSALAPPARYAGGPARGGRVSRRRAWFPVAWYVATVVFFSLPHVKKNAYLLPVAPAQALITAQAFAALRSALRHAPLRKAADRLAGAQLLLGLGFAAALPFFVGGGAGRAVSFALAGAAIAAALLPLRFLSRGPRGGWAWAQSAAYAIALAVFFGFAQAPFDNARSAKPFCRQLLPLLRATPDATLLVPRLPEEAALYLPLDVDYDATKPKVWIVLDDRRDEARAEVKDFAPRVPDGKVTAVRRLDLPAGKGGRWKVFEARVGR